MSFPHTEREGQSCRSLYKQEKCPQLTPAVPISQSGMSVQECLRRGRYAVPKLADAKAFYSHWSQGDLFQGVSVVFRVPHVKGLSGKLNQ